MRPFVIYIFFFLLSTACQSEGKFRVPNNKINSDGIDFQPIAFAQALSKSKQEKKLIFIDTYATWCGPCKKMDQHTFSHPEVQKYFNRYFINLKVDVDQAEGNELAKKFAIDAIPTLLFVNEDGSTAMRLEGYYAPDKLLEIAKELCSKK